MEGVQNARMDQMMKVISWLSEFDWMEPVNVLQGDVNLLKKKEREWEKRTNWSIPYIQKKLQYTAIFFKFCWYLHSDIHY